MCLIIKENTQKLVATEPVRVYKLVLLSNNPPYNEYTYRIGLNTPLTKPEKEPEDKVGEGYLHAYTDKYCALWAGRTLNRIGYPRNDFKVIEMYIPAGTTYYLNPIEHMIAAEALEWRPESEVYVEEEYMGDEDLPF